MNRLRENTVVTLSLPTGGTYRVIDFEACVIAVVESGVALQPIGVDPGLLPAHAENVFLTFVHCGQLIGLKGALTSRRQSGGVRFQVADGVQRRRNRYTRVEVELPVTVAREGQAKRCAGTTVDVAPEGLLLRAPLDVGLGDRLEVAITLPGHEDALRLSAIVVRHGGGLFAVHFPGDPMVRAAVAEFVVERRAADLSGTRVSGA